MSAIRKIRFLILLTLIGLLGLISISYVHAYRFTHFSSTSGMRTDPKNLTIYDKVALIFTGIQNPHQKDLTLPEKNFETLSIEGDKKLESWFIPNEENKALIIFYHGYAGNKSQMLSRAKDLHELGYSTAIVGFRGSGNSEGDYTTIGFEESKDVINSFHYYKNKFPTQPMILFGTSMGAAAILKALGESELDVKGIVLEYPFGSLYQSVQNRFKVMGFPSFPMASMLTYFGGFQLDFDAFEHNPAEYARNVNVPTLYLAGDRDDRVTDEETQEVFQNLNAKQKHLYIFKGAGHENINENFYEEWIGVCEKFLMEIE